MGNDQKVIILALDPGKTTGAVRLTWDGRTPAPAPGALLGAEQVAYANMPTWLEQALAGVDLLVIERFIVNARTMKYTRQPEPLHVIGGAMFLAKLAGVAVREQSAADAKTVYPNSRLKEMGWFISVRGVHARDALRHALLATHVCAG